MKCLQCGSEDILTQVRVVDRGKNNYKFDLQLETYGDPDAFIFKDAHRIAVSANVCCHCGFIMLSTSPAQAKELKENRDDA